MYGRGFGVSSSVNEDSCCSFRRRCRCRILYRDRRLATPAKIHLRPCFPFRKAQSFFRQSLVVWAVDGVVAMDMDVDVDSSKTNSNSKDSKSEKEKGKRNLYVGSQALNYRKDHMEILEIGKRRMIVADPKGTNHFSSLAYTLFTVFYG
uniref:Uncharacterized protein n=1 Tax=Brassica campestris TaxID=3711 RepID=M4EYE2_BRACM